MKKFYFPLGFLALLIATIGIFSFSYTQDKLAQWVINKYLSPDFTYEDVIPKGGALTYVKPKIDLTVSDLKAETVDVAYKFNWLSFSFQADVVFNSPKLFLKDSDQSGSFDKNDTYWFLFKPYVRVKADNGDLIPFYDPHPLAKFNFNADIGDTHKVTFDLHSIENIKPYQFLLNYSRENTSHTIALNSQQVPTQLFVSILHHICIDCGDWQIERGIFDGFVTFRSDSNGPWKGQGNLALLNGNFINAYTHSKIDIPRLQLNLSPTGGELILPKPAVLGELNIEVFNATLKQIDNYFMVEGKIKSSDSNMSIPIPEVNFDFKVPYDELLVYLTRFLQPREPDLPVEDGHLSSKGFPLKTWFSLFSYDNAPVDISGIIDFKATFDSKYAVFLYDPKDVVIENDAYKLAITSLKPLENSEKEYPARHDLDYINSLSVGTILVEDGVYHDKRSGLVLEGAKGKVEFKNNTIIISDAEIHGHGLSFFGGATICHHEDKSDTWEIAINSEVMHGKLSDLQILLNKWDNTLIVNQLPIEGTLTNANHTNYFTMVCDSSGSKITANLQGSLVEGRLANPQKNLQLQDLTLTYEYKYPQNTLSINNIHGTVLAGDPENAEEYTLSGDHVYFTDLSRQHVDFDFWVGDRNRDLVRFAGHSRLTNDDKIEVAFDRNNSHLGTGTVHELHILLASWSRVDRLRLKADIDVGSAYYDLKKLLKAGILPIFNSLVDSLSHLDSMRGDIKLDVTYNRPKDLFDFKAESQNLVLNDQVYKVFNLISKSHSDNWHVENFQLDNLSLSADLEKIQDFYKIKFMGLSLGKSIKLGLDGFFYPKDHKIETNLNLVDVNMAHANEIPGLTNLVSFEPQGQLRAKGKMIIQLTKDVPGWYADAQLVGTLNHLQLDGITFQDIDNVDVRYISNKALTLKSNRQSFKPLDGTIEILSGMYNISEKKLQFFFAYPWNQRQFNVKGTALSDLKKGVFEVTEQNAPHAKPLLVNWTRQGNVTEYPSVEGTFSGLEFNLQKTKSSQYAGSVVVNLPESLSLITDDTLKNQLVAMNIGPKLELTGDWKLKEKGDDLEFNGTLKADKLHFNQWLMDNLAAKITADSRTIVIKDLVLDSMNGNGKVPLVEMKKTSDGWEFISKEFSGKGFKSYTHDENQPVLIDSFVVRDLSGVIGSNTRVKGQGDFSFINFPIKNLSQIIPPSQQEVLSRLGLTTQALVPVGGSVYFDIKDDKIVLTKLKDVHTENRLFRFILAKSGASSIDFAGNLDLNIGIQPYNLLLRGTDVFSFKVNGTTQKPSFNFSAQ